jgi:CBS domain-containing protein
MHERDIGALPVMALHGRIVGMITATDVMHSVLAGRVRKGTRKARRPRSR